MSTSVQRDAVSFFVEAETLPTLSGGKETTMERNDHPETLDPFVIPPVCIRCERETLMLTLCPMHGEPLCGYCIIDHTKRDMEALDPIKPL